MNLASGVGCRHSPPQTLGAVHDDDTSICGLLKLLQQVRTVIGGISTTVGLQDHTLHWWLQESSHLETDIPRIHRANLQNLWPTELAAQLCRIKLRN